MRLSAGCERSLFAGERFGNLFVDRLEPGFEFLAGEDPREVFANQRQVALFVAR